MLYYDMIMVTVYPEQRGMKERDREVKVGADLYVKLSASLPNTEPKE